MSIISTAVRTILPALTFFHLADLQLIPRKKQSHTLPKSYICRTKSTWTHYRREGSMILRVRGYKLLPLDNVYMTRKFHLWFISNMLEWQDLHNDTSVDMPTHREEILQCTTMFHLKMKSYRQLLAAEVKNKYSGQRTQWWVIQSQVVSSKHI